jgi:CubicO group peptidase (beta-lactamase class C family)
MMKRKGKLVYLGSSGWAQLPNDGSVGWGPHVPMNIASVSKFVTAVATIRLLRESNISVKTPIAGFLPRYWPTGPGVDAITFHDLLRHESGLGSLLNVGGTFSTGPGDFATAKAQIALGNYGTGTYDYKNINFAILRVLFATLTGTLDPGFDGGTLSPPKPNDAFWDFISATAYCKYVNDNLFAAADIAPREFKADDIAAKAYGTPPMAPGWRVEDDIANAGPRGWQLSIGELTRLLGEFRRGGSILSPWRAERLLSNSYGLAQYAIATNAGPVYTKGGRLFATGQTMTAAIFLMPNDVEFAIFVNSGPTTETAPSYLDDIPKLIQDSVEFNITLSSI